MTPDFFAVENEHDFFIRDNHLRFIQGIWLAMGLIFIAAALKPIAFVGAIIASTFMILIGDLSRFTAGEPTQVLGSALLPFVIFEFVVFPLVAWWLVRHARSSAEEAI